MDWNRIRGRWIELSGQVKETWGKLTDNDLRKIDGQKEKLQGKLVEIYGIRQDEAKRQIREFEKSVPD